MCKQANLLEWQVIKLIYLLKLKCYVHKLTENNIRDTISLTIAQTLKQERRRQYEKEIS